ncbi:hypothetical protein [Aliterella atlantica]|uniref:Uncharacterized protein n=1 Tax=Aliterella atlantica CENA595 TaxID=1618023 RepID=A0A0D8ZWY7_9CYAN|nr:hypothetical protein [Aliterella atlantica]KJH73278.1 hypothetical protein UH38_00270 [Aliterella atlantica CENA595]
MFSGFSRRKLIKILGAAVATSTAFESALLLNKWQGNAAQAQDKGRVKEKLIYQDREIIVLVVDSGNKATDADAELYISGKKIKTAKDKKSGKYVTGFLPFDEFSTLTDMAKDLIDLGAVDLSDTKKVK